MKIQLVYIQKKDVPQVNNEYLVILKLEDDKEYDSIELNKIIYTELYKSETQKDINYMRKLYLKKGMLLNDFGTTIWDQFVKLKLENMKLINLIDDKMTNKILTTDILYFNYNRYKEFVNPIISNIILSQSNYTK